MTAVLPEPSTENPLNVAPRRERQRTTTTPIRRRGAFTLLRSVLFWSHVVMGISGGVIILIMSITGALLGFERQLIARFDGVATAVPPNAAAQQLPLDSLLRGSQIDVSEVASILLKADRNEPVSVRFRERDKAARLLDPYSGATIAAVPRGNTAEFMSWLRGWHRWLGVTGEHRPLMRNFTGSANIAFLLLVLSGLYIWWPKRMSKAAFKTAAVFNPRLSGKPRDFNWHNSLGFWSAIPLAFVIATGVFISYSWPGQSMDRLWGSENERAAAIKAMNTPVVPETSAPPRAAQSATAPSVRGDAAREKLAPVSVASRPLADLGAMLATVKAARPDWQAITVTTASPKDSVVQFAVAEGNTYRPDLKTQYFFGAESGALMRMTNFDSLSTSRKIRGWMRFGHTGEIFGAPGQAIATFVSFVGAILVYTGLALSWRRLRAFIRRKI